MFDYNSAKREGYSDPEIFDYLKNTRADFDFDGASREGYSVREIASHVATLPPKERIPQPVPPVFQPIAPTPEVQVPYLPGRRVPTPRAPAPTPAVPTPTPTPQVLEPEMREQIGLVEVPEPPERRVPVKKPERIKPTPELKGVPKRFPAVGDVVREIAKPQPERREFAENAMGMAITAAMNMAGMIPELPRIIGRYSEEELKRREKRIQELETTMPEAEETKRMREQLEYDKQTQQVIK